MSTPAEGGNRSLLRCTHCVPAVAHEASGPSYAIVRLCDSLRDQGAVVELATLDDPGAVRRDYVRTFKSGWGPRNLGRSPDLRRWLRKAVAQGLTDIVHNHSLWMMPNVYPGLATRASTVPLVVSPRGTLSRWAFSSGSSAKKIFWPLLQQPAIRDARCFHATSESEADDIRRMEFRQPIAVIPNGIDIPADTSQEAHEEGRKRTLLFLGRLHPIKGLDMLLGSWALLERRFPDWQLDIVGPSQGNYLEELRGLAGDLRVSRVTFRGELFGDAKWDAYRHADLFVLPSRSENFGVAVAEALASGTPAVVTKGAPWQGLESEGAGWWPDISVEALASALEEGMQTSRDGLQEMGRRGRSWVARDYSWTRIGEMMFETYRWILGRRGQPEWIKTS